MASGMRRLRAGRSLKMFVGAAGGGYTGHVWYGMLMLPQQDPPCELPPSAVRIVPVVSAFPATFFLIHLEALGLLLDRPLSPSVSVVRGRTGKVYPATPPVSEAPQSCQNLATPATSSKQSTWNLLQPSAKHLTAAQDLTRHRRPACCQSK